MFRHQHGDWREDYRAEVPGFHAPGENRFVAVAEDDDSIEGYVGWSAEPEHGRGRVTIAAIGTGGDDVHAPARALYERLGCTPFPGVHYFWEL